MKIITPKITALLMLIFMLGFVIVADAAFEGKKNKASTESVSKSGTEVTAQAPPTAPSGLPASDDTLLLVILCFFIPPLAVYLKYDEAGKPFIVNVILTLLCGLPGVIHALIHVLRK
jgi:uncharacterized membrane protein YqaE (UPF0057 family)